MQLTFKSKEENVIYFEDMDWLVNLTDLKVRYNGELNIEPVRVITPDRINSDFKQICEAFIDLVNYLRTKYRVPFLLNYTNELLEIELRYVKEKYTLTEKYPPVFFERKLSITWHNNFDFNIQFNYPDNFKTELYSECPRYLDGHNCFPIQKGGNIEGREFSNKTIELILKKFILDAEEQFEKTPYNEVPLKK